ncbi:MAG: HK97 gp10 family phage protein [Acidobacteria bacterium]|nr:HK97 gp10 family phage protein [Acidobacteriota bacterium]
MFEIEVKGLDELIRALERMERDWREEVADGLGRAARTVAEATADDTPVDTGRAKAGLRGMDGRVTAAGAEARIVSTGTPYPSAFFHANERDILEHDAEEAVLEEAAAAMDRALKRAFK